MTQRKIATRQAIEEDSRQIGHVKDEGMKPYTLSFPPALMERLRDLCKKRGLSLAAGARQAVSVYLEKEGLL